MNLAALKLVIIQKIITCDDLGLLTKMEQFLVNTIKFEAKEQDSTYEKSERVLVLNEWQEERINRALPQYENGEFLTAEEDKIDMKKWFEEQEKLCGF
jgi:hypothetical protein